MSDSIEAKCEVGRRSTDAKCKWPDKVITDKINVQSWKNQFIMLGIIASVVAAFSGIFMYIWSDSKTLSESRYYATSQKLDNITVIISDVKYLRKEVDILKEKVK